ATEASTPDAPRMRDGGALHPVPRGTDQPKPEYDDFSATVTAGAARTGRAVASPAPAGARPGGCLRGRAADAGHRAALRPATGHGHIDRRRGHATDTSHRTAPPT